MAPYWEMLAQECLQRNNLVCRWWHACQRDNLMSSFKDWLFFISGFVFKALVAPFHTLVLTGFSAMMSFSIIFTKICPEYINIWCISPIFKFTPIIPPSSRPDQCWEHSRASLFCSRDWSWPFPLTHLALSVTIRPRVVKMFILCFSY